MNKHKWIYLINTLLFLIAYLVLFFTDISEGMMGGISGFLLPVFIVHLFIFITFVFKADFSRSGNYISSVFNWIVILSILFGFYGVLGGNPKGGYFAEGYFLIFFLWPAMGIASLISWISSFIFYKKNKIGSLDEKTKSNEEEIKLLSKKKWTLILGLIISIYTIVVLSSGAIFNFPDSIVMIFVYPIVLLGKLFSFIFQGPLPFFLGLIFLPSFSLAFILVLIINGLRIFKGRNN